LPLCMSELWRRGQLASTLPGRFLPVDGKIPECSTGALGLWRTRTATFARPDVGIGAVAQVVAAVVEWLACGTDIAVAFGLISKPLWTVEWAVLSVDTVAGSHIGSDAP